MNFLKNKFSNSFLVSSKEENKIEPKVPEECPEGNQSIKDDEEHKDRSTSLWKSLSNKLGMDLVIGVTFPVWLNEPTTILQRQAEMIHFHELLTEAASFESSLDRIAYVAAFGITAYNGTERFGKPFNPLLGETFEFEDKDMGIKFLSEQVSHHPPISACHCEGKGFVFWQDSRPKSKFLGNSIELDTQGSSHVFFPRTGDHFVYSNPTSRVNNLILGRMWIEHCGLLSVTNIKNGETCIINFEKCSWLGKGLHEFSGYVKDSSKNECLFISGKWTESINVKWMYEKGKEPRGTTLTVWKRPSENSFGKYKLTEFAVKILEFPKSMEPILAPTDSRWRPDRLALERGDLNEAGSAKHRLEEKQRADRKARLLKNEEWNPRWFKQIPTENNGNLIWVYCGDYWEQRAKKIEILDKLKEMKVKLPDSTTKEDFENKDFTLIEVPLLTGELEELQKTKENLLALGIEGLACDFRIYKNQ